MGAPARLEACRASAAAREVADNASNKGFTPATSFAHILLPYLRKNLHGPSQLRGDARWAFIAKNNSAIAQLVKEGKLKRVPGKVPPPPPASRKFSKRVPPPPSRKFSKKDRLMFIRHML